MQGLNDSGINSFSNSSKISHTSPFSEPKHFSDSNSSTRQIPQAQTNSNSKLSSDLYLHQSGSVPNGEVPFYDSDPSANVLRNMGRPENRDPTKASSYNNGMESGESMGMDANQCNEGVGAGNVYIRDENRKIDAESYEKQSKEHKDKHFKDFEEHVVSLGEIRRDLSSLDDAQRKEMNLDVFILEELWNFLKNWGPKRCFIHLKLANLYNMVGDRPKKVERIIEAEKDLDEMTDNVDVAECRRWLYLLKAEDLMQRDDKDKNLALEEKLLNQCWNVRQKFFVGKSDLLDFYAMFMAMHLRRAGNVKKAKETYDLAYELRKQRKEYRDKDDFDWDKLDREFLKLENACVEYREC